MAPCTFAMLLGCGTFSSTDSPPTDAGGVVDGGDSDGGGGDSSKPFCEGFVPPKGTVRFCRDFDDGKAANDDWTNVEIGPGRTLALDTTTSVSPPASLLARLDANGAGCASAQAVKSIPEGLSAVTRIAFDVRVGGGSNDPFDGGRFLMIEIAPTARMVFEVSEDGKQVWRIFARLEAEQDYYEFAQAPALGEWGHFDITLRKATNDLQVNINGKPAYGPSKLKDGFMATGVTLDLSFGMNCEATAPFAREVRLDNIVVVASDD